ncbi:unnamed protein product [Brachionus calyciflorus]|uniref:Uncharacterized protein n=1 Tax=Brachionus calyciflorus TaxID=104777 RepID=A0A813Z077_9BILA|nr:unnamed protein product [Brachionus calyciflorus]
MSVNFNLKNYKQVIEIGHSLDLTSKNKNQSLNKIDYDFLDYIRLASLIQHHITINQNASDSQSENLIQKEFQTINKNKKYFSNLLIHFGCFYFILKERKSSCDLLNKAFEIMFDENDNSKINAKLEGKFNYNHYEIYSTQNS